MVVGFGSLSSINASDEMIGYESLPLSRVPLIKDRGLRLCHVAREEEALCPSDQELTLEMAPRVHGSLSSAFNLSRYNSSHE